ncbi:hypothetical protein LUA82_03505 [Neoehrlichia mikurensis]|uniref:Uncharacterized protein n=1 Tax=Neoehrlichia mikurensis TaxID=89586 RepID=A0A9Q9F395_9RICK|nr:hypothetical protein [Neoehrlichia mikurensis]UTO55234.1 hypothetical protein LUA82_03505 [Neoehrlichia mikurensis]UTO56154.1 hypothetical protein LUA81_03470 [Neoehrlichia mikurensis]
MAINFKKIAQKTGSAVGSTINGIGTAIRALRTPIYSAKPVQTIVNYARQILPQPLKPQEKYFDVQILSNLYKRGFSVGQETFQSKDKVNIKIPEHSLSNQGVQLFATILHSNTQNTVRAPYEVNPLLNPVEGIAERQNDKKTKEDCEKLLQIKKMLEENGGSIDVEQNGTYKQNITLYIKTSGKTEKEIENELLKVFSVLNIKDKQLTKSIAKRLYKEELQRTASGNNPSKRLDNDKEQDSSANPLQSPEDDVSRPRAHTSPEQNLEDNVSRPRAHTSPEQNLEDNVSRPRAHTSPEQNLEDNVSRPRAHTSPEQNLEDNVSRPRAHTSPEQNLEDNVSRPRAHTSPEQNLENDVLTGISNADFCLANQNQIFKNIIHPYHTSELCKQQEKYLRQSNSQQDFSHLNNDIISITKDLTGISEDTNCTVTPPLPNMSKPSPSHGLN